MLLASVILVFFARVAQCQNIETYRYDVDDVTSDVTTTSETNSTIDGPADKRNGSRQHGSVEEDFVEAPSNHVELSREMQKVTSPGETKYIPICCEPGFYLIGRQCTSDASLPKLEFPPIYDSSLSVSKLRAEELIPIYGIPCASWDDISPLLTPPLGPDVYFLLENGTIFNDYSNPDYENSWHSEKEYCWTITKEGNETITVPAVCFGFPEEQEEEETISKLKTMSMYLSLPFLLATFITYSILPELKTMHGSTLRTYVACLFVAYAVLATVQFGDETISRKRILCLSLGILLTFVIIFR